MPSSFESATLYTANAASGQTILMSSSKILVSASAQGGGAFWLRVRSPDAAVWTPASPIPAANAVAAGWARVVDGTPVTWGHEDLRSIVGPIRTYPVYPKDYIAGFDVWCEITGSLAITGWG